MVTQILPSANVSGLTVEQAIGLGLADRTPRVQALGGPMTRVKRFHDGLDSTQVYSGRRLARNEGTDL